MECRTNGLAEEYDFHPVYGRSSDVKRYCSYKLWEDVNVKYNIMLETRPNYEVIYANEVDSNAVIGEVVQIDQPRTMYYEVPEDSTLFGKDAGSVFAWSITAMGIYMIRGSYTTRRQETISGSSSTSGKTRTAISVDL